MSLIDAKTAISAQIDALTEARDAGKLSEREFKRQFGPLSRELLGDKEYEHARQRKRKERRRRAEIEEARDLRRAQAAEKAARQRARVVSDETTSESCPA